jgi:hypothetical protein
LGVKAHGVHSRVKNNDLWKGGPVHSPWLRGKKSTPARQATYTGLAGRYDNPMPIPVRDYEFGYWVVLIWPADEYLEHALVKLLLNIYINIAIIYLTIMIWQLYVQYECLAHALP